MKFKQLSTIVLALLVAAISANAYSSVYVVSAGLTGNGVFGTIDLATGDYRQIGPGEPDGYFGLAPGPNGSLVSLTYTANLDSIDPATGVPARVGATGLGACLIPSPACGPNSVFGVGGLNGKLFATDFRNDLYTVNSSTGATTLLSNHTGIPESPFVLGSQNPDGTLNFGDEAIWGAGGKLYATFDAFVFDPKTLMPVKVVVAPQLYGIDPQSGVASVIGPTDLGIGGATDVNGGSYVFDDLTNQISTIDSLTGKTSLVGPFDSAAGVVQGAAATPEPSSIALAIAGAITICMLKRLGRPR